MKWFVFIGICIAIIGGVVLFSKPKGIDVSQVDPTKIETSGEFKDYVFGNRNAKVVLIEYGDYQCPGCGAAHPTVKTVTEKYKNDVAFVFRNLPLTSVHPNALAAASTAEAAGKQGKFWEMHNLLFDTQSSWENAKVADRSQIFEGYASDLGLKMDIFKADSGSEAVADKISRDRALAQKLGANSTPTFYLNGIKLGDDTWKTVPQFEKVITDALKAAGVTPKPVKPAPQSSGGNY